MQTEVLYLHSDHVTEPVNWHNEQTDVDEQPRWHQYCSINRLSLSPVSTNSNHQELLLWNSCNTEASELRLRSSWQTQLGATHEGGSHSRITFCLRLFFCLFISLSLSSPLSLSVLLSLSLSPTLYRCFCLCLCLCIVSVIVSVPLSFCLCFSLRLCLYPSLCLLSCVCFCLSVSVSVLVSISNSISV